MDTLPIGLNGLQADDREGLDSASSRAYGALCDKGRAEQVPEIMCDYHDSVMVASITMASHDNALALFCHCTEHSTYRNSCRSKKAGSPIVVWR